MMTMDTYLEKIIIPTIQAGNTTHSKIILTALVAVAYRAGMRMGDRDGALHSQAIEEYLADYMKNGWAE